MLNLRTLPKNQSFIFQHEFFKGHLTRALTQDLLEKSRNPVRSPDSSEVEDEEALEQSKKVPLRIPSRPSGERTRSELNMESVNFEAPLVTVLSVEPPPARYPEAIADWGFLEPPVCYFIQTLSSSVNVLLYLDAFLFSLIEAGIKLLNRGQLRKTFRPPMTIESMYISTPCLPLLDYYVPLFSFQNASPKY